ncbi:MAG: MarR family transcriptional regulator [Austwickia sp.]|jgi:DNA-binding MarR family transcriptional regulator|nr:MAG: MarR family transcriptional regulator [Austwickia sp.]
MDAELTLDNQLCFALNAAARAAAGAYRSALGELGLTYPQFLVLLALWEADGQSVSELGDRVRLDSGTLSPLLRRLAEAGMVERRRSSSDERRVTIHLTDAGRDLQPRVADVQRQLYRRLDMTPEEIATLRSLARRFYAASDH